MAIYRTLSVFTLLFLAHAGEGKLQYTRQKPILPVSKELFAAGNHGNIHTKFVEVQRKGDLTKWIQTIDGVPVYNSILTTRTDPNGKIDRVQGFTVDNIAGASPTPTLSKNLSIELLKVHWDHEGLSKVNWRVDEPELYYLANADGSDRLVWFSSYYVEWKNEAEPEEGFGSVPAYIIGLVDAHTGKIQRTWNSLESASVESVVGNAKIGASVVNINVTKETNTWCSHVDHERRIKVFNIANEKRPTKKMTTGFICDRADNKNWDLFSFTGGYSPRNEAFLYATKFIDMWRQLVGRELEPYKNKREYLRLYTHFGVGIEGAFFNGYNFLFGDGKVKFYPATSLDIVCHELAHGVTAWVGSRLEYYNSESGAMNEAYSDIFGETCDMYFRKKTDYLIGEEIMRPGQPKALRDMCNPAKFGDIDHYSQYNTSIDLHHTSGIYNKAWCKLTKTRGWDYIKTFQVFTDANLMFWKKTSTMHCGACDVEDAAADHGLKRSDVRKAFATVGVNCKLCEESLSA